MESFERLRQCFNVIKENHIDPWCWHEYLNDDLPAPEEMSDEEPQVDDDDDPEMKSLKPRKRSSADRLKTHLLATVSEFQRASQAADMCYYHMSSTPEVLKECVVILGTSGDVDEEMLRSGDASPQKILANLQEKLKEAYTTLEKVKEELEEMKARYVKVRQESETRWKKWQAMTMRAEEAMTRLDALVYEQRAEIAKRRHVEVACEKLRLQKLRTARLMIYKGREVLKVLLKANKKENLFYAFVGFIHVLTEQRKERLMREQEAQRDLIESCLRSEVRFLLAEQERRSTLFARLTGESHRLKNDRRALACRKMHRMRPYEPSEYVLWAWELWQSVRFAIPMEKQLEREAALHELSSERLLEATGQVQQLTHRIDALRREVAEERAAHDLSKRVLTEQSARYVAQLHERLHTHRVEEMRVLARLHELDCESKDERIELLQREIAEDHQIHALKLMVIDLESRLRRALDRRRPRGMALPPTGQKCAVCEREILVRSWKGYPKVPEVATRLAHSLSEADLSGDAKAWELDSVRSGRESPFAAVWRPV